MADSLFVDTLVDRMYSKSRVERKTAHPKAKSFYRKSRWLTASLRRARQIDHSEAELQDFPLIGRRRQFT